MYEWYTFILPITTMPAIILGYFFIKHVVPTWFKSFTKQTEEK
jgi:hypothetical protein